MDVVNHQYQKNNNNNNNNNKKLSKVLSTKLSIEDYNAFVILTKLEYEAGLIKVKSTSELLRFTIRHIINQVHSQPEYLIIKQEQQQEKQVQNDQQQQLGNHDTLQHTNAAHFHVPKSYQTSNLHTQKITTS